MTQMVPGFGHIRVHATERFQVDRPDRRALKRLEEKLSLPDTKTWQQDGASMLLEPLLVFAQQ